MKSNALRKQLAYSMSKKKSKEQKKVNILSRVSGRLLASEKNRPKVNLGEISRNTTPDAKVLVPGKVLGDGILAHKVTIIAYSFSESAKAKIKSAGGSFVKLADFMESGQDTKGMILLG